MSNQNDCTAFYKLHLIYFLLMILFTCCFTKTVCAQPASDKVIPDDKLKWEYYTVKPDSDSNFWATTLWNVYYKYHVISFHFDTIKIQLQTWHTLRSDSWVLKDKESDELLHHEQGHFNTAILFEEEFKKAIDTTTLLLNNYDRKIDSVYNTVLQDIRELNVQYDKETNHMWDKEAQKHWDEKINDMIGKATK